MAEDVRARIGARLGRGQTGDGRRKTVLATDTIDERYIVRDEEEFRQTREHYGWNLERMAALCRDKGVPLVLCTAPSDLRDSPPFHTVAGAGLPEKFLSARLQEADARMRSGQWAVALFDAEKLFEARSPDGIPGRQLFLDNCHPRPEGHALLAKGLGGLIEEKGLLRGPCLAR